MQRTFLMYEYTITLIINIYHKKRTRFNGFPVRMMDQCLALSAYKLSVHKLTMNNQYMDTPNI